MDKSSEIFKYFQNHNKLVPINIQTLLSEKSTIHVHTKGNTLFANTGFIACEEKNRIVETN